jgi:hypothetical protein
MQRTQGMMIAAVAAAVALALGGCDRPDSNRASTAPTTASSTAPTSGGSDNNAAPATGSTTASATAPMTGTTSDNNVAQATGSTSDSGAAKPADNATDTNGNVVAPVADDAAISARVARSIQDDPLLKSTQIKVDAKAGTVVLTGTVATADLRDRAHQIAAMTPGVAGVVDNVAVKNAG